jgi:hypothetical protein
MSIRITIVSRTGLRQTHAMTEPVGRSSGGNGCCSAQPRICPEIADTRAKSVATAFIDGALPAVSVADREGGHLGHGVVRQMCLARLLRDATYYIATDSASGLRKVVRPCSTSLGYRRPSTAGITEQDVGDPLTLISGPVVLHGKRGKKRLVARVQAARDHGCRAQGTRRRWCWVSDAMVLAAGQGSIPRQTETRTVTAQAIQQ